jgi:hypothetical protein
MMNGTANALGATKATTARYRLVPVFLASRMMRLSLSLPSAGASSISFVGPFRKVSELRSRSA